MRYRNIMQNKTISENKTIAADSLKRTTNKSVPIINTREVNKKSTIPSKSKAVVKVARLTLRKDKSIDSEAITTYPKDTKLIIDHNSSGNGWLKVISPDTGYVKGEYVN